MDCKTCNDTYYIIGPSVTGRIRSIVRCSCNGSRKDLLIERLRREKKYVQIAIQDGVISMEDVVKILTEK